MTINREHLAGLELALDEMHSMLDGSCEARLNRLIAQAQAAPEAEPVEVVEIDWPEYHYEAMGCGLEDRGITDRYEAMQHGWDCAMERCAEQLPVEPLMTVAQHNRIMASAPQPDAELVELHGLRPVLAMILNALDRDAAEGKAARGEIAEELRAKLATLSAKNEGGKA